MHFFRLQSCDTCTFDETLFCVLAYGSVNRLNFHRPSKFYFENTLYSSRPTSNSTKTALIRNVLSVVGAMRRSRPFKCHSPGTDSIVISSIGILTWTFHTADSNWAVDIVKCLLLYLFLSDRTAHSMLPTLSDIIFTAKSGRFWPQTTLIVHRVS